jgi:nucleoside-diphosphate-sugar epimerase
VASGRGVVRRIPGIYGPHSPAIRTALAIGRRGLGPFVGRGDAYQPLVWDEDAAAALVTAAESPNLGGTFDVADDEPLTRTQLASALAVAVGRRRVRRLATPWCGPTRRADGVPPA